MDEADDKDKTPVVIPIVEDVETVLADAATGLRDKADELHEMARKVERQLARLRAAKEGRVLE